MRVSPTRLHVAHSRGEGIDLTKVQLEQEAMMVATPPTSGTYMIASMAPRASTSCTLPAGYESSHPYRLIFAFHGQSYTAAPVADGGPPGSGPYYGIEREANDSAIFVARQAISGGGWSTDLDLVNTMLEQLESRLCLDEGPIFATGFGMGAILTTTLGGDEGDVFRSLAARSGEISGTCEGATRSPPGPRTGRATRRSRSRAARRRATGSGRSTAVRACRRRLISTVASSTRAVPPAIRSSGVRSTVCTSRRPSPSRHLAASYGSDRNPGD